MQIEKIETGSGITFTPEALLQVKSLLEKEGESDLGLRVFVSGGGCSGLQYGMAFDHQKPGDEVYEQEGVKILVDEQSLPYIRGSVIDYVDSLMGAGFTVQNPNAVHSCSCGHSFDTGEDSGSAQSCGCGH
jgi:iron-sulfur cluster assembly accessory protein